ncbi:MAG: hypothetical protein KIT84_33305 [Labilithrix sp.]|nr:hypothetical protein [Labilithrix sp.]MCW5815925.1 hypothetical protein [Labilithrix sp.]
MRLSVLVAVLGACAPFGSEPPPVEEKAPVDAGVQSIADAAPRDASFCMTAARHVACEDFEGDRHPGWESVPEEGVVVRHPSGDPGRGNVGRVSIHGRSVLRDVFDVSPKDASAYTLSFELRVVAAPQEPAHRNEIAGINVGGRNTHLDIEHFGGKPALTVRFHAAPGDLGPPLHIADVTPGVWQRVTMRVMMQGVASLKAEISIDGAPPKGRENVPFEPRDQERYAAIGMPWAEESPGTVEYWIDDILVTAE